MTLKDLVGLGVAIVVLGIVAVVVQSQYTSGIVSSLATGFGSDISAAKKQG